VTDTVHDFSVLLTVHLDIIV